MEFIRKHPLRQTTLVVFFGFLLTTSIVLYQPLSPTYLALFPSIIWTLIQCIVFLSFIIGYFYYFTSKYCSFLLQIAQYCLLPIAAFAALQQISLQTIDNNRMILLNLFSTIFLFIGNIALAIFKIIYLIQVFPEQHSKQILHFSKITRIYRVLKLFFILGCALLISTEATTIVFTILNCLDFLIINTQITFIEPGIEQVLMLASLNTLMSISVNMLLNQNQIIWEFVSEGCLLVSYFLIDNPMQFLMEFKYLMYFRNMGFTRNDFQKSKEKHIVILLLQCFGELYDFENQAVLVLKKQAIARYSDNFILKFKKTYMHALYFYLSSFSSQQQCSQNMFNISNILKKSNTASQQDIQAIIISQFKKRYKKTKNIKQIVQDKLLFFNFVSFCMDNLEEKDKKNITWNYSAEFFLVFTAGFNRNFIMKALIYCYNRQRMAEESFPERVHNSKINQYIRHYKLYYEMSSSDLQNYIMFENLLQNLKKKIYDLCMDETKLIYQLTNPTLNTYQCEQDLIIRQGKKNSVLNLIDKCFQHENYLYFQEFTYLFLLFSIIFCKSTHETVKKIRTKFIIPQRDLKISNSSIIEIPTLVCCGLGNNQQQFGQIILTNVSFRKNFGFYQNGAQSMNRKVNDLIVAHDQKTKHLQLMLQSSKFSENILTGQKHKDYKCYLKINLESEKMHFQKEFSVSTSIFQCYQQNLMYLCYLQQKSNILYMDDTDYQNLKCKQFSKTEIKVQQKKLTVNQLGKQMKLIQINLFDTGDIGYYDNFNKDQNQSNSSLSILHPENITKEYVLSQEEEKLARIQLSLWRKDSFGQPKLFKYLVISLIFFVVGAICLIGIAQFSLYKTAQSDEVMSMFSNLMSSTQGCEMRICLYLYLIRKIAIGELSNTLCNTYNISDLNYFFQTRCSFCINNRINQYFISYYHNPKGNVPMFDPSFISSISATASFSNVPTDYSNYISNVSATSSQYLTRNFTLFDEHDQTAFFVFIRDHSNVDISSFSLQFINTMSISTISQLNRNDLQHKVIFFLALTGTVVCFIIFIIFSFKMFSQYLNYFDLLGKLDDTFYQQRMHQVKFISNEIEKLSGFYFKKCTFPTNYQVIIETRTVNQVQEVEINLNQFEKLASGTMDKIEIEQSNENHTALRKVFNSKQKIIISTLCCCILMIVLCCLIGFFNQSIIFNSFKTSLILKQGVVLQQTLYSLNFVNWMTYLNQSQVLTPQKYQEYLESSHNYIKSSQFFNLFYNYFDRGILNQTIYANTCTLIANQKTSNIDNSQCINQLDQLLNYYPAQLVSIIAKRQYDIWNSLNSNNSQEIVKQLCRNTVITLNQVIPAILSIWKTLIAIVNLKNKGIITDVLLTMFAVIGISTIIVFFLYIKNYFQLTRGIKLQVLTMNTPKQLYENQHFRPYLNFIYYKYKQ